MSNQLRNALPTPGIPHPDDVLRPTASDDLRACGEGIDGTLDADIIIAGFELEDFAGTVEVPEEDFPV